MPTQLSARERVNPFFFAWMCCATSVAIGATYMFTAGAPRRYILINFAALAVGVFAAPPMRRLSRDPRFAGVSVIVIGLALAATAMFGTRIEGASRWIAIAGIALQPSLILLPAAMMIGARHPSRLSAVGLSIAGIALALQPDRAMAGVLAAGAGTLWLYRRELPVTIVLITATAAFTTTLFRADALAPVPFVERVMQSAFAFHPMTGVAIFAGLLAMLLPWTLRLRHHDTNRDVRMVFGATWLAIIAAALLGNYATPLVGYGSSAILGYCLSATFLAR